jgi:hypothetical protein
LETTTKSGNKTCWSYFSTNVPTLFWLMYSMMHYNPSNLGSSWRAHILCVARTLKVIIKPKKDPTH